MGSVSQPQDAPQKLYEDPETGEMISKSERAPNCQLILQVEALDTDAPPVKRRTKQRETQKKKAEKAEKIAGPSHSKAKATELSEDDLNPNVRRLCPNFKCKR
jgi:lysyl-tRNA synthetase class 2